MLMLGSNTENAHLAKKPTTTRSSFSTRISLCGLFEYVRTRYEYFRKNTNYVLWQINVNFKSQNVLVDFFAD